MENLMQDLINAVNHTNNFGWSDLISLISMTASWLVIYFLVKEVIDRNRPYLQISFEPVRSTLACVVIKNVGTVPLSLKSLVFNNEFINQLDEDVISRLLNKKIMDMPIFPNRQVIFALNKNTLDIINKFNIKTIKINYIYTKLNKSKEYKEEVSFDYNEFIGLLIYSSELDELKNELNKNNKEIINTLKDIKMQLVDITKYEDEYVKRIAIKNDENENQEN